MEKQDNKITKRREQTKAWRNLNKDKIRKTNAAYYLKNKEKMKQKNKEWMEKNKERREIYIKSYLRNNKNKIRAHEKALKISTKDNCEECGAVENLERHHEDYSKPLEIKTLCRRCHLRLHRSNINSHQETKSKNRGSKAV